MIDGGTRIDVLRSADALERHREIWTKLCRHRDSDLEFFRFIVSTGQEASPYVLLLHADGEDALVVGRIERVRLENKIGYLRVPTPKLRVLELIHGGVMGQIDPVMAREVVAHLRALLRRGEVDAVRLHYADVTSPLFVEIGRVQKFFGRDLRAQRVPHQLRNLSAISSTFEESVSRNERSNQRRREKQLLSEYGGDIKIKLFETLDDVAKLMSDSEYVAAKSYQRGIGVGFVHTRLMQQRLELLAAKGYLCAWVLYLADVPAAFWIGALRDGTFFSDYLAYDIRLSRFAPGTYLTMKVLQDMQDRRSDVRLIDFGLGDAPYKARFGTDVRTTATLRVFASTWRGYCAFAVEIGALMLTRLFRALLARFDALGRVKRWQRRRAANSVKASQSASGGKAE
jgi:hypothetical protein